MTPHERDKEAEKALRQFGRVIVYGAVVLLIAAAAAIW